MGYRYEHALATVLFETLQTLYRWLSKLTIWRELKHFKHCIGDYQKLTIWREHYCWSFLRILSLYVFRRMTWSVRNSLNDSSFSSSTSNGSNGRTRIIRVIQEFQSKLGSKIQEVKKNLPMKLLFFLVGFYCATAFATVIGQTGDWDILSAALAVAVVEVIGALMYRASLPLVSKNKGLISLFNYWKAGLTLGLFLDSFKYWFDCIVGWAIPSMWIEISHCSCAAWHL